MRRPAATWTNYGVTDASGAYAINLPAGNYKLLVQTNTAGYPDTWYGGTTFANATTVVVDGAETVNITVDPQHLDLGHRQQGTAEQARWSGAYVTAYEATTATWTNYGVTDASGAYAINLPAGSYKLLDPDQHGRLSRHLVRRLRASPTPRPSWSTAPRP